MMYRLLAYAVMVTDFAFLAHVAVGGFVACRRAASWTTTSKA
ncbi:hypothetical protein ACIA8R_16995 [Nonomuraea sp. NPDC051191]